MEEMALNAIRFISLNGWLTEEDIYSGPEGYFISHRVCRVVLLRMTEMSQTGLTKLADMRADINAEMEMFMQEPDWPEYSSS